jgi:glycosyltransferase involved in cell wall biosynthesis
VIRAIHLLPDGEAGAPGGAVVHVQEIGETLRSLGVDATVSTLDEAPAAADIVHLYVLGHLENQAPAARAKWPGARFALTPIWVPWETGNVVGAADASVLVAAAKNIVKNRLLWSRCRSILARSDAVFPTSGWEARTVSRYYRVPQGPRWRVATTGLHIRDWPPGEQSLPRAERAAALGLPEDVSVVVVCAARLEPRKNQRTLVRAAATIPGAGLVLVGGKGKQPYSDEVLALGRKLLGERFRWLGLVSREETRRALRTSDVFVLCSIREMASIAALEGAASGCEIVVTRSGSTEEYYGELAHLCSTTRRGVAAAIEEAMSDPRQPGLRRRIVDAFDWTASAKAIVEVYREIVPDAR